MSSVPVDGGSDAPQASADRELAVGTPPIGTFRDISYSALDSAHRARIDTKALEAGKERSREAAKQRQAQKGPETTGAKRKSTEGGSSAASSEKKKKPKPVKTAGEIVQETRRNPYALPAAGNSPFTNETLQSNPLLPVVLLYHPESYYVKGSLPLVDLPSSISPPPLAFNEISRNKQFSSWMKWWREAGEELKKNRIERLGPTNARKKKYTAGAGLRKGKPPVSSKKKDKEKEKEKTPKSKGKSKAAQTPQTADQKTPKKVRKDSKRDRAPREPIEDQLIPGWRASIPPVPSTDFCQAPPSEISYLLRAWDFITSFRNLFKFEGFRVSFANDSLPEAVPLDFPANRVSGSPLPYSSSGLVLLPQNQFKFPLPTFLTALFAPPSSEDNFLLDCLFSSLTQAAIRASASNSLLVKRTLQKRRKHREDEKTYPMIVVNPLTWQAQLRFWLTTMEEVRDNLELRAIAGFLAVDTFYQLETKKRLTVFRALVDTILSSSWIRDECEKGFTEISEVRRRVKSEKINDIATLKKAEVFLPEVSKALNDMVGQIERENGEPKRNAEGNRRLVDDYCKLGQERLKMRREALRASWESQISEVLQKHPVRTECLGEDRHYHRYWHIGNSGDYLFIEFVNSDKENDLSALLNSSSSSSPSSSSNGNSKEYNPWGYYHTREHFHQLNHYLNHYGLREIELRKKINEIPWDLLKPKEFSQDEENSLWSIHLNVYEEFELSKRYAKATEALAVANEESDRCYKRCELCQESVATLGEFHCFRCHSTIYGDDEKTAEKFRIHQEECTGLRLDGGNEPGESDDEDLSHIDSFTVSLSTVRPPQVGRPRLTQSSRLSESSSDSDDEEELRDDEELEVPGLDRQVSAGETSADGEAVKKESSEDVKMEVEPTEAEAAVKEEKTTSASKEKGARTIVCKRISPRFYTLDEAPTRFRVLKALLLDLEAAIPLEAVPRSYERGRQRWINRVKDCCSLPALSRRLEYLFVNLKKDWLRDWFKEEEWLEACKKEVRTEAQFAANLFAFDSALIYSEADRQAEQVKAAERRERDRLAKEEEENMETSDGCRVCGKNERPEKILVCEERNCNQEYHIYCLKPPLRSVPKGRWFCPKHEQKRGPGRPPRGPGRPKKSRRADDDDEGDDSSQSDGFPYDKEEDDSNYGICSICDKNEGDPLLCDGPGCNRAAHLDCLDPPLTSVPDGEWFCDRCEEQRKFDLTQKLKKMSHKSREKWLSMQEDREEALELLASIEVQPLPKKRGRRPKAKSSKVMDSNESFESVADDDLEDLAADSQASDDDGEAEFDMLDTTISASKNSKSRRSLADPVSESESLTDESQVSGAVDDEDAVCGVDFNGDSLEDNPLMLCENCDAAVHIQCYGLKSVPEGAWLCQRCEENLQPNSEEAKCALCGEGGLIVKKVTEGEFAGSWCHLACVQWTDGVYLDDEENAEGIGGLETIDKSRWRLQCEICSRKAGVTSQCDQAGCKARFHPICALRDDHYKAAMVADGQSFKRVFKCKNHANQ